MMAHGIFEKFPRSARVLEAVRPGPFFLDRPTVPISALRRWISTENVGGPSWRKAIDYLRRRSAQEGLCPFDFETTVWVSRSEAVRDAYFRQRFPHKFQRREIPHRSTNACQRGYQIADKEAVLGVHARRFYGLCA